jgi:hypothetical protein
VSGDCVDDFSAALLTILSRGLALFLGLLLTACFGLLISLLLLLSSLGACCVGAGFALLCCLRVSFLSAGLTVFAILTNLGLLLTLAGDGLSALNLLRCSTNFRHGANLLANPRCILAGFMGSLGVAAPDETPKSPIVAEYRQAPSQVKKISVAQVVSLISSLFLKPIE